VKQSKIYIYGRHALTEALTNAPDAVRHVYFGKEMQDKKLRELAKRVGVSTETLDQRKVTSWVERNAPHQGAVALISLNSLLIPYEKWTEQKFLEKNSVHAGASLGASGEGEFSRKKISVESLVLLNEVQDPHNVGTIIRSAAAFGVSAVLMPQTKQAPVTGAVIKSSAGMAFSVPLVSITNIQQTISDLKKKGFRVYGLAGEGKHSLADETFDAPAVFIMGNESQGLPKSTAELCDKLLSIPIESKAESLNVAAAAAITLYAWHTKRQ
jgi:23S rRNA (guanosine2251-2'-O)-methyltransferase